MHHPFDGIILPAESSGGVPQTSFESPTPRRTFFGRALAAVAGLFTLGAAGTVLARDSWRQGSRGRWYYSPSRPSWRPSPGRVTTYAVGEEGGGGGGRVTTYAVGEEGGGGRVTTYAVGEEGGGGGGRVTTYAVGEEGGGRPPGQVTTFAVGEEGGGRVTTRALGEEGGGR